MTNTYHTNNPLGSTAVKDLSDNASNFDEAMNSESPSFLDRFGARRETWAGFEAAVENFLINAGYQDLGAYAAGVTFTQRNQVVDYQNSLYRVAGNVALPYTLTGTWATDSQKLVLVFSGDNTGVRSVDNILQMRAISSSAYAFASTNGYYDKGDGGAGDYYMDNSDTTTPDNGITVIEPNDSGGRWKLIHSGEADLLQGGVRRDGVTDSSAALASVLNCGLKKFRARAGTYIGTFTLPPGVELYGIGYPVFQAVNSSNPTIIYCANGAAHKLSGIVLDGGASANVGKTNGLLHMVNCTGQEIDRVVTRNGSCSGMVFVDCDNDTALTKGAVNRCRAAVNWWDGVQFLGKCTGFEVTDTTVNRNKHHGLTFKPAVFPFVAASCKNMKVIGGDYSENVGHGIFNSGLWSPAMTGDGDIDYAYMQYIHGTNQFMADSSFTAVKCDNNYGSGAVIGGRNVSISGCSFTRNGLQSSSGGWAGLVMCGYGCTISSCTMSRNRTYGIDFGGAFACAASALTVDYNGEAEAFCIGVNIGASSNCSLTASTISYNGTNVATSRQLVVSGIDGDGVTAYPQKGVSNVVTDCVISCQSNNWGVQLTRQTYGNRLSNLNINLNGGAPANAIRNQIDQFYSGANAIKDVTLDMQMIAGGYGTALPAASTLVIPDSGDYFEVSGTTAISQIYSQSRSDYDGKLLDVQISNEGLGYLYTAKPVITISGAGSGATFNSDVTKGGQVKGAILTASGSGYSQTSTTAVIGAPPSGGTQAVGTPIVGCQNNVGREITLLFNAALSIQVPGMLTPLTSRAGSTVRLRGQGNGSWAEISRAA